jgi:predicted kinase
MAPASTLRVENEANLAAGSTTKQEENAVMTARGSSAVEAPQAGRVHLILGPVGAGKSTFAIRLANRHAAIRFTLDEWMAILFRQDRPDNGIVEWYVERTARCIDQIWILATQLLAIGTDVILEIGLLERRERERFYERADDAGFELTIYVLDAPRDVRRQRVEQRNRAQGPTFSMLVPAAIFELASDRWDPLDRDECANRDVQFVAESSDAVL